MPESATSPTATVIVSTYNRPDTLEKALWGFEVQTFGDFELIVADDGSTDETADLIRRFQTSGFPVTHLWQEDNGFGKNRILNKAIAAARSPYLIFTDGDCIPRSDFVANHLRLREPGKFLAVGSHIGFEEPFHHLLTREAIQSGDAFRRQWLDSIGYRNRKTKFRLSVSPGLQPLLNWSSHRRGVFTGNGSSVWRDDAVAVNGFDEDMDYGGDDKEFGVRLAASGVRSKMGKYSLLNLHLNHDKPYMNDATVAENHRYLKVLQASKSSWTHAGIK